MLRETILVFATLLALAYATQVNKCGRAEKFADGNQIRITNCDEQPCKLKRRTTQTIEQKFVADKDIENVVHAVSAIVLGVPLPFVGVDGTSACSSISNLDGTPAGCSLKKGQEYIYKRDFDVLQIYPTISMVIHYALMDGNHTVACFEVPAKIVK
ncbi:NPC intracellular cholesterol transporter 2-like [Hylaeus volcanicus]|uniref:NPC intracellular cholesterol transporter 2-like n=1 Tax=Hylaeus volcanicus TaxID=313075 RepID=UPI0023B876F4|nr:NPC intracellular cholesterol transporter 2-like [Hylaeus volcanicus]